MGTKSGSKKAASAAVGDTVHIEGEDYTIAVINGNTATATGENGNSQIIPVKELKKLGNVDEAVDAETQEWTIKGATHPRLLPEIPKQAAAARRALSTGGDRFYLPGRLLRPANHTERTVSAKAAAKRKGV